MSNSFLFSLIFESNKFSYRFSFRGESGRVERKSGGFHPHFLINATIISQINF